MPIPKIYFSSVIFLSEISIQCDLYLLAYEKLEKASEHWIAISKSINDGNKFSPLSIISEATVCLSAMSAINRLLYSSKTSDSKKRCNELQNLLGDIALPNITSKMVRNSWEHHDERIDKELKNINEPFSLSFIHVSVQPPPDKTLVLKRFNPIEMTISFLSDSIQLTHCKNEVSELKSSINTAFNLLNNIHIEAPNK
ncbi:hypothetical protein [Shewanella glacialipiscicola]|uniref:BRO1 domain-containing protein n=1 Tax=Shewanella glacialipiscicola TaxID=614069 RepID=A0ABQ6J645_9GAMM|nr:hypothetical protein [Shewanella glacialipiscicola]MCL1085114.1 hypothetical protein [Shewanella glacialipiscicola]GIU06930.1 hypothetical protein TUM4636_09570 [Shewanella glacialipiscicola]GMA83011.1 hypothetical protein GCM10025855_25440 [Shewanella glacialipiscicola]